MYGLVLVESRGGFAPAGGGRGKSLNSLQTFTHYLAGQLGKVDFTFL